MGWDGFILSQDVLAVLRLESLRLRDGRYLYAELTTGDRARFGRRASSAFISAFVHEADGALTAFVGSRRFAISED